LYCFITKTHIAHFKNKTMKKIISSLFFVCMNTLLCAQNPTQIINDADFWDGEERIDSLSNDFETTGDLLYKRFFRNTKIVEKEYLKIAKDSFLFVQYDKDTHRILQTGKLVPMPCCSRDDSIVTYDLDTYSEGINIVRYLKLGKEGEWREAFDSLVELGVYKNNERIGEWLSWRRKEPFGFEQYSYYNRNGEILYAQPKNIAETQDSTQIAHRLLGNCWAIGRHLPPFMECVRYDLNKYSPISGFLEFSTDALIYTPRGSCGEGRPPNPIGTWSLKGDILSITGTALQCKKYKIVYLSKTHLDLKEIYR
jgi:hypothetical protein